MLLQRCLRVARLQCQRLREVLLGLGDVFGCGILALDEPTPQPHVDLEEAARDRLALVGSH